MFSSTRPDQPTAVHVTKEPDTMNAPPPHMVKLKCHIQLVLLMLGDKAENSLVASALLPTRLPFGGSARFETRAPECL